MTILIAQQKNGELQLNESLQQLMNNLVANSPEVNWTDSERITKDLRVQWRADSSGNWALHLLADTDSRLFRIVPSLQ